MNGVYKLEADLTVDNWTPIGEFPGKPFTGILRGNNKTVTINSFSEEGLAKQAVGLFGYTAFAEMDNLAVRAELDTVTLTYTTNATGDNAGIIGFGLVIGNSLNINLKNVTVSGEINKIESTTAILAAGGMIGLLTSGKIETSQTNIDMVGDNSGHTYIGGIAGYIFAYNGTFTNPHVSGVMISGCSVEGSIEGSAAEQSYAGGITGHCYLENTTIRGCQFEGNITASKPENNTYSVSAGGIVGKNSNVISIGDCDVGEGTVMGSGSSGSNYAGGIIGDTSAGSNGTTTITRCTSSIDVIASFDGETNSSSFGIYAGGISGANQCAIQYCFTSGFVQAQNMGTITGSGRNRVVAGGISGQNTGSITQCYTTGDVESLYTGSTISGHDQVASGGITGITGELLNNTNTVGIVSDCYYDGGEISAKGNYANAGGIAGFVAGKKDSAMISHSYARGAIFAEGSDTFGESTTYQSPRLYKRDTVGGIAGSIPANSNTVYPTIKNCVALFEVLTVTGPSDFYAKSGRIVGTNEGLGTTSAYNEPKFWGALENNAASSTMNITRIITGGATTTETVTDSSDPENTIDGKGIFSLPDQTVYTDLGWDFVTVWKMGAAGYPVFAWQN
jgi:hypothetical protein